MGNIGAIPTAVPIIIDSGITAPATGNTFTFSGASADNDFSVMFQVVGTVTTLVSSLQVSLDGGATWDDYKVAANFLAQAAGSHVIVVTPMVAGALYRINYQATTAGNMTVRAVSN